MWVGEEVLFLKENQPFQYSVVTRTPVVTLQITKELMFLRMDPEYLNTLIEQA